MHTITIVSAIAFGAFIAPSFAQDNRPAGSSQSQWLSIPQIHAKLESAGYHNVEKIERERGSYEVRATNHDGRRVKLYLNPQTGETIDQQRRETMRNKYGRSDSPLGQRDSGDCSKRRCRDDLSQPGVAIPPTGK